jgi:hypothetical protein
VLTGAYFELLENAFDMLFHSSRTDEKACGNLSGAESMREQGAKLGFA